MSGTGMVCPLTINSYLFSLKSPTATILTFTCPCLTVFVKIVPETLAACYLTTIELPIKTRQFLFFRQTKKKAFKLHSLKPMCNQMTQSLFGQN
jgi:hypothetical protein